MTGPSHVEQLFVAGKVHLGRFGLALVSVNRFAIGGFCRTALGFARLFLLLLFALVARFVSFWRTVTVLVGRRQWIKIVAHGRSKT